MTATAGDIGASARASAAVTTLTVSRCAPAALGMLLVLAGCGGEDGTTDSTSTATGSPSGAPASSSAPSPTAPSPGAGPTRLVVVVTGISGAATSWKLTCDPPGGDHPDAAAACAALAAHGATALPPVPADQACTMIYGGPQKATVSGSWRGQRVSASLNRTNGCEIARWEALIGLLPSSAS